MLNDLLEKIKAWYSNNWPTIRSMLWRLLRGSVATAISQTVILACGSETLDPMTCYTTAVRLWSTPEAAGRAIAVSLAAGFLLALSVGIRDSFGNRNESKGFINKLPI